MPDVKIRALEPGDLEIAGRIIYRAFSRSFRRYGYPEPVTDTRGGSALAAAALASDPSGGLVLESAAGRPLGVSFTQRARDAAFIGPVAIDPDAQGRGYGRRMLAEILAGVGDRGVRLLQDAFNPVSYRLYARAGFGIRETLALLVTGPGGPYARPFDRVALLDTASNASRTSAPIGAGPPHSTDAAWTLRDATLTPMTPATVSPRTSTTSSAATPSVSDVALIARLDTAATGVDRSILLERLAQRARGVVLDGPDEPRGFACAFQGAGVWVVGPGWAEDCRTLAAIIMGLADRCVRQHDAVAVFAPTSQSDLIEPLLDVGFRVSHLVNLMVRGDYRPLSGACLPVLPVDTSVLE